MSSSSLTRRLLAAAVTAAALAAPSSAGAAIGPAVENSDYRAYATSACSAGRINASVHVTSKRHNLYLELTSAGLYNGTGGMVTSTGRQGYPHPLWAGWLYATQRLHWGWINGAPRGGRTAVFYVNGANTPIEAVRVSCVT